MSLNGDDDWLLQAQKLKFRSIKLRRTPNHIEENLKTLSSNKKVAQERYYASKQHQSPLTRAAGIPGNKPPVHQRLGVQRLIKRSARNGLANRLGQAPPNRLRLRRMNQGTMSNGLSTGNKRRNPAQQRLHRIYSNNQLQNLLQPSQYKTKLFRRRKDAAQPTNFTVQVDNTNFRPRATIAHSVKGSLNPQMQSEIQTIQNQSNHTMDNILPIPINVPGYGYTGVSHHIRFSQLP